MGKINMGIFYGKKYNPRNRTFSLENGENIIEGTGQCLYTNITLLKVAQLKGLLYNIPYVAKTTIANVGNSWVLLQTQGIYVQLYVDHMAIAVQYITLPTFCP